MPLGIPPLESGTCFDVCIESKRYCNGIIDLTTGDEFNTSSDASIFVAAGHDNYTISDVMLYPDEIYCSSRLHVAFMLSYILSFVSFSFAIAIVVRTRPIIHFLIRRRTKEIQKKDNVP